MGYAAAEDNLLAEEVRLRLFLEGSLDNASFCSADAAGISQSDLTAIAGSILINSEYVRNSAAFFEGTTNEMTRSLRSDHEYIHILRSYDLLEMDIEAMSKSESTAGFEVRSDFCLVDIRLLFIRNQDHGDIRLLNRDRKSVV
jgi:hypothetical protein